MSEETASSCALFEMVDSNFGMNKVKLFRKIIFSDRKIADSECPHTLYIQNYSSAASSCIVLRRWLFNVDREMQLCETDVMFKQLCFWQAVNDVNNGQICASERLYQLKALQNLDRIDEV
jgi:sorting nexin-27